MYQVKNIKKQNYCYQRNKLNNLRKEKQRMKENIKKKKQKHIQIFYNKNSRISLSALRKKILLLIITHVFKQYNGKKKNRSLLHTYSIIPVGKNY